MSSITGIWHTTDDTRDFLAAFYFAASKVFQPISGMTAEQAFAVGKVSNAFLSASRDSRTDEIPELNKTVLELKDAVRSIEFDPGLTGLVTELRTLQKLVYRAGGADNRSSLGKWSGGMF